MASSRPDAAQLIAAVADPATFEPWDTSVVSTDPLAFPGYPDRLAAVRDATGSTEAVRTGRARMRGREVALIAGEFAFLGGSIGVATGERVTRAFERAADAGLPLLAMPMSGGTRMQEGTLAFVQMVKAAAAVRSFTDRGLPYVAWLGHPTMGGVLASWGSLGHVTFIAPGATAGFTGGRVVEALTGEALPPESQQADNLLAHGLVDDVVALEDLAERVDRVLSVCCDGTRPVAQPPTSDGTGTTEPSDRPDAWEAVECSRRAQRPGARELLSEVATDLTPLRGDRTGADDPACLVALGRVAGVPAVVVAQDRAAGARMGPGGYRKARRAMAVAQQLGLVLFTIVDTPGAEVTPESEAGGLSGELARSLSTMTGLSVPTVAVLLGEGGGGGALSLLPADRVIAAEHSWLSPLLPEGASAILHRTTGRAPEVAQAQAITSWDLRRVGLVDAVVPEQPCAADEPEAFVGRLSAVLARVIAEVADVDRDPRLAARHDRYRRLGNP